MAHDDNKGPLEKILTATIDGLAKGDLSGLNDAITSSVESVLDSVEDTVLKAGDVKTKGKAKPLSSVSGTAEYTGQTKARQEYLNRKREEARKKAEEERISKQQVLEKKRAEASVRTIKAPFREIGSVSSVLNMVFGGVGAGIFGITTIIEFIGFINGGASALFAFVSSGVICAASAALIAVGNSQKKRLKRAKRIALLCGDKMYMPIDELAAALNTPSRRLTSDVKTMLKKGFFPEGHIDSDKTTLMLKDSVYDEYLRVSKERRLIESDKGIIDTTAREVDSAQDESRAELDAIIREGEEYINRLSSLNDDIPGEVISNKLDRLEGLLKDIFACLKKHPEQRSRMHEVMNYYLPTVLKLVEAYKEYDGLNEAGREIIDAKAQIESSIDAINEALRTILDNLFRDSVWDVTTDAEVLNTMLAQRGLTK